MIADREGTLVGLSARRRDARARRGPIRLAARGALSEDRHTDNAGPAHDTNAHREFGRVIGRPPAPGRPRQSSKGQPDTLAFMSGRRKRTKRGGERHSAGHTWLVATQPGLGKAAAVDLRAAGVTVHGIESDGRSDLVAFDAAALPEPRAMALAEDVFVTVGVASTDPQPRTVAARLFDSARWQEGAEIARSHGVRIGAATGFRVIVRVRSERDFKRTDLRAAVISSVQHWRPRWRIRDPADLEIWVLETRPGQFRAALRISTADMRSRGGKAIEREGSLRPTVAAALVRSAGPPRGLLLDPFCGSGTVLREAQLAGWKQLLGTDADPDALTAARANLAGVELHMSDATALALDDGAVAAIATNAPFGIQHAPQTQGLSLDAWWRTVLAEFGRVVGSGGIVALLHPDDSALADAIRATPQLSGTGSMAVRTLGQPASIWTMRRT